MTTSNLAFPDSYAEGFLYEEDDFPTPLDILLTVVYHVLAFVVGISLGAFLYPKAVTVPEDSPPRVWRDSYMQTDPTIEDQLDACPPTPPISTTPLPDPPSSTVLKALGVPEADGVAEGPPAGPFLNALEESYRRLEISKLPPNAKRVQGKGLEVVDLYPDLTTVGNDEDSLADMLFELGRHFNVDAYERRRATR